MNNRERLINCVQFNDIDRPPYLFVFGPWAETIERWKEETNNEDLNIHEYFKVDKGFFMIGVNEGMYPAFEQKIIEEDDKYVKYINPQGITIRTIKKDSSMPEFLDYPVKNADDWEKIKKERFNPDDPERYEVDFDHLNQLQDEGYAMQVGRFPFGVFGTIRDLMGVEKYLMSFALEPDLIKEMMNYLTDFWLQIWDRVSQKIQIDHIHIWEDMSGKQGPLISPDMIEEFMMPNYRKIKEFADAKDIPIMSVDTDGNCDLLIPIMKKNGVNLMFPFEVQAGSDVERYRKQHPNFAMMGGLDKRALAKSKKDIDQQLARAERMFEDNGYIAGPDHLVPPDVSWENYKYYMENLRQIIGKKA